MSGIAAGAWSSFRRARHAPEYLMTDRLEYRRPGHDDADRVFTRYASDPEVTRYLAWPRHISIDDTRAFLDFSTAEWRDWGCGPYLVFSRADGELIGSTGISFSTAHLASTGYLLARDAWGVGYATEVLGAMRDLGRTLGIRRLYGICHLDHRASKRVMEKCGFHYEGVIQRHLVFPNISPEPQDVLCYAVEF